MDKDSTSNFTYYFNEDQDELLIVPKNPNDYAFMCKHDFRECIGGTPESRQKAIMEITNKMVREEIKNK